MYIALWHALGIYICVRVMYLCMEAFFFWMIAFTCRKGADGSLSVYVR